MYQRRNHDSSRRRRTVGSGRLLDGLKLIKSRSKVILYSWMTSISFHIVVLSLLLVAVNLLTDSPTNVDITETKSKFGALGVEDVTGDLLAFELPGDVGDVLEIPAGGGNDSVLQMNQAAQQSFGTGMSGDIVGPLSGLSDGVGSGSGGDGNGVLLKVPKSGLAVTKGSFTAFTIPAQPKPRESYSIVIEMKLPPDVAKYRVSDLSGEVSGSDNYSQRLPYDQRTPYASGYPTRDGQIKRLESGTVLYAIDGRIQIVIKVPGAERLVKDEIHIRSKRLREQQKLTLIFQEPSNRQAK